MNDRKEREPRPARAYYRQMSDATADELYVRILQKIVVEKRYRDPDYTARQLAAELGTTATRATTTMPWSTTTACAMPARSSVSRVTPTSRPRKSD